MDLHQKPPLLRKMPLSRCPAPAMQSPRCHHSTQQDVAISKKSHNITRLKFKVLRLLRNMKVYFWKRYKSLALVTQNDVLTPVFVTKCACHAKRSCHRTAMASSSPTVADACEWWPLSHASPARGSLNGGETLVVWFWKMSHVSMIFLCVDEFPI